jgi:hypothetical protein
LHFQFLPSFNTSFSLSLSLSLTPTLNHTLTHSLTHSQLTQARVAMASERERCEEFVHTSLLVGRYFSVSSGMHAKPIVVFDVCVFAWFLIVFPVSLLLLALLALVALLLRPPPPPPPLLLLVALLLLLHGVLARPSNSSVASVHV